METPDADNAVAGRATAMISTPASAPAVSRRQDCDTRHPLPSVRQPPPATLTSANSMAMGRARPGLAPRSDPARPRAAVAGAGRLSGNAPCPGDRGAGVEGEPLRLRFSGPRHEREADVPVPGALAAVCGGRQQR